MRHVVHGLGPTTTTHHKTQLATIMMEQTASGMQGALADTKNYWRLVEIKDSIASMELQASPLDTLVDANRTLVGASACI